MDSKIILQKRVLTSNLGLDIAEKEPSEVFQKSKNLGWSLIAVRERMFCLRLRLGFACICFFFISLHLCEKKVVTVVELVATIKDFEASSGGRTNLDPPAGGSGGGQTAEKHVFTCC